MSHRLTQQCKEGLPSYIKHVVMPMTLCNCPSYEHLWREQRPDKVAARVALCGELRMLFYDELTAKTSSNVCLITCLNCPRV